MSLITRSHFPLEQEAIGLRAFIRREPSLSSKRKRSSNQSLNGWDQIGIHDNFFDLGGHSLAATRVVSQVIKKFQIELPLQLLFQSPTVAEMAAVIAEHNGKKLGDKELDSILTQLESLSDKDAQRVLADV